MGSVVEKAWLLFLFSQDFKEKIHVLALAWLFLEL